MAYSDKKSKIKITFFFSFTPAMQIRLNLMLIVSKKMILHAMKIFTFLIEKTYEECGEELWFMTRVIHKPQLRASYVQTPTSEVNSWLSRLI